MLCVYYVPSIRPQRISSALLLFQLRAHNWFIVARLFNAWSASAVYCDSFGEVGVLSNRLLQWPALLLVRVKWLH